MLVVKQHGMRKLGRTGGGVGMERDEDCNEDGCACTRFPESGDPKGLALTGA